MHLRKCLAGLVITIAVLLLAAVPGSVAYEQWQLNQKKTYDGIPLDSKIEVEVSGHRLILPAGYFAYWSQAGTPEMRERKLEKLVIHFWMPGKAYPGFDSGSVVDFRPRYKGQDSDPSTYIVEAVIDFHKRDEAGYVSPLKRSEDKMAFLHTLHKKPWYFETTSFGLEHLWIEGSGEQDDLYYRTPHAQDPQAYFKCLSPASKLPNPGCEGYIHFVDDGLSIYVEFPPDVLGQWQSIVLAVRDFVDSWQKMAIPHQ